MSTYIIYIFLSIFFLTIGLIVGKFLTKNIFEKVIRELDVKNKVLLQDKNDNMLIINSLNENIKTLNAEKHELDIRYVQKIGELKNLEEKLHANKSEVEKLEEKFTKDFEILASKILEEKSTKFTEQNKENLKKILNPKYPCNCSVTQLQNNV